MISRAPRSKVAYNHAHWISTTSRFRNPIRNRMWTNSHSSQAFHYVDKGMLATIGRGAAVAKIGRVKASGVVAWLLWLFVHILFLIGFRNRLIVMIQWA